MGIRKKYPLSENELRVIEAIKGRLGKDAQIFAIRRVEKPDGIKTPDLIVNGKKVEIKKVSSKHSVRDQTRKALNQGSTAIFYDVQPKDGVSEEFLFSEIKKQTSQRGILNYIAYKAKNTASSRERIDSVLNDLIISQNSEKVNKISVILPEFRNKSPSYWQKRSLQRTVAAERQALPYIRKLRKEYARSSNRSINNVRRIYENYFNKAGFDRQKLREIVPSGEFSELLGLKYIEQRVSLELRLVFKYRMRLAPESTKSG